MTKRELKRRQREIRKAERLAKKVEKLKQAAVASILELVRLSDQTVPYLVHGEGVDTETEYPIPVGVVPYHDVPGPAPALNALEIVLNCAQRQLRQLSFDNTPGSSTIIFKCLVEQTMGFRKQLLSEGLLAEEMGQPSGSSSFSEIASRSALMPWFYSDEGYAGAEAREASQYIGLGSGLGFRNPARTSDPRGTLESRLLNRWIQLAESKREQVEQWEIDSHKDTKGLTKFETAFFKYDLDLRTLPPLSMATHGEWWKVAIKPQLKGLKLILDPFLDPLRETDRSAMIEKMLSLDPDSLQYIRYIMKDVGNKNSTEVKKQIDDRLKAQLKTIAKSAEGRTS